MVAFNDRSDTKQQPWTVEDIAVFSAIDPQYYRGIVALLQFLIRDEGVIIDETIDLTLIMNTVVSSSGVAYTFEQTENVLMVAAEFCLIDTAYDKQNLCGIELLDNSVIFLAMMGDVNSAVDAAVCLSKSSRSRMSDPNLLPSLSLFGEWETIAAAVVAAILSFGSTSCSMSRLYNVISNSSVDVLPEVEFISTIRRLCAVKLLFLSKHNGEPLVTVNVKSAGLFLLFSERVELARRLAKLSA